MPEVIPAPHQQQPYRGAVRSGLKRARVVVQQTDLGIYSDALLDTRLVRDVVLEQRGYLEAYIAGHPAFLHSLQPLADDPLAPPLVREMMRAAEAAGVGPMAAVAGALAECVGLKLQKSAGEIIVENGGDIFLSILRPVTIAIFAGPSPLSLKIGLKVRADRRIRAICTSSGTVGHSLSFGKADAVCVLAPSGALADAAATAVANRVTRAKDLRPAISWGKRIAGLQGIVIIQAEQLAAWGDVEIVHL